MQQQSILSAPLSLWGGVECTVNRVGDRYFDQLKRTGHDQRIEDLDLFAELGIKAMRYPVLWERVASNGIAQADWTWSDARLTRLRELGIQPIVGLTHHGSGPRDTSLLDPNYPEKLAHYARAVAERYPWVTRYTPVNEPLTTARFSGLYGHWYPHGQDDLTFVRALLNQCRGVQLAMQAIREINPKAQLVQTEDLGKTHSTAHMAYQAEFENERRWLSFDLLCGLVNPKHPLWGYLQWLGLSAQDLNPFLTHPCPPDLLGINSYITSERFLDERVERYPVSCWGGNDRDNYADIEAVRVCLEGIAGPAALLREAWERYRIPIAVTEAHIGCEVHEQMRWLQEIWQAASRLRREGAAIEAVTAWSLLGAYDWDSLVTRAAGHYEPGAFCLVQGKPEPTELASMIRDLGINGECNDRVLIKSGWWRRPERLLYPEVSRDQTRTSEQEIALV